MGSNYILLIETEMVIRVTENYDRDFETTDIFALKTTPTKDLKKISKKLKKVNSSNFVGIVSLCLVNDGI